MTLTGKCILFMREKRKLIVLLDSVLQQSPTLVVRYRHQRFVSIETDTRTGKVKAFEASDGCSEGDGKREKIYKRNTLFIMHL